MDRELLIEVGCEEIPASWLPPLTAQFAQHLDRRLKDARLTTGARAEAFSTPRRLAARVTKLAERQTDLEDLVTGPPVSAAFKPDGEPTPAAVGFARKYNVEVSALERERTAKGEYLAYKVRQRGKATVDVLADVMAGLLRDLTFPKHMRWDAYLDDGKGELTFARPIRWVVLLYGGRVVPFVIRRTELAQGPTVQDVRSAANTYGHRFLTTSGRAGRAIKIKTFEDYEARLLENFVILNRSERESKIRRELETHARKLGGRVSSLAGQSSLLQEVPDLVEYPSVVAGHFPVEFLSLPQEVLTTTMVHHQHYVPVVDEEGRLKPAFLAVTNMQVERPEIISRNSERVLTARLRDARFFWEEDRKGSLESRLDRLSTILFHKKLGSYKEKAQRVSALAGWIAREALAHPDAAALAERAGLLAKADLATDMVRELTELQGTMGGIYAREEGLPEEVWKAIYFHYLPIGVDADAAPSAQQLGKAAVVWAAVSLADKLDSIVGMFSADERPTGSRDPLGLRRLGNGVMKLLADLPGLTGLQAAPTLSRLLERAAEPFAPFTQWQPQQVTLLHEFFRERYTYLLEERGFDVRNVRAVVRNALELNPAHALKLLKEMAAFVDSAEFQQLAVAFKRVKNLAKDLDAAEFESLERSGPDLAGALEHPSEKTLLDQIEQRRPIIESAVAMGDQYRRALTEASGFKPYVDRFFDDVRVKTDNAALTSARLRLLRRLEGLILKLADISEIVAEGQA
ncbi:MAG TPA: glycine--tRNA ligase subunit beta [Vicinamibacterales bacterium]|nr:glycine--tRNA ligase subunit beta [Vicinamibacterales bacterium]